MINIKTILPLSYNDKFIKVDNIYYNKGDMNNIPDYIKGVISKHNGL